MFLEYHLKETEPDKMGHPVYFQDSIKHFYKMDNVILTIFWTSATNRSDMGTTRCNVRIRVHSDKGTVSVKTSENLNFELTSNVLQCLEKQQNIILKV